MSTAVEHGVVVPEPAVKAVEDRERHALIILAMIMIPHYSTHSLRHRLQFALVSESWLWSFVTEFRFMNNCLSSIPTVLVCLWQSLSLECRDI